MSRVLDNSPRVREDTRKTVLTAIEELEYIVPRQHKEDKETIFEVTSIRVESLPEEIKAEVRNEKKIEGTKKLYGFLENYSS